MMKLVELKPGKSSVTNLLLSAINEKWNHFPELKSKFEEEISFLEIVKIEYALRISYSYWNAGYNEKAREWFSNAVDVLNFNLKPSPKLKKYFSELFKLIPNDMSPDRAISVGLGILKFKLGIK